MKLTASSIEGMTETELLHNYIIGLDNNMYERVAMERTTTLDQAMHTANTLAAASHNHPDQGTEFVNKTVQALLDKTGIERRVTSSYNPRTDGMAEIRQSLKFYANTLKQTIFTGTNGCLMSSTAIIHENIHPQNSHHLSCSTTFN